MKLLTLPSLLIVTLLMTGCQSFQFVESPIPVKNLPSKNVLVKAVSAIDISVENNEH